MLTVLTRKQMWRRQRHRVIREDTKFFIDTDNALQVSNSPPRTESEPAISTYTKSNSVANRTSSEPALSVLGEKSERRVIRNVRWNPGVRVVLIPTSSEYRAANTNSQMWWADFEIDNFKDQAVDELKRAMKTHNIDSKAALKLLYQPANDDLKTLETVMGSEDIGSTVSEG